MSDREGVVCADIDLEYSRDVQRSMPVRDHVRLPPNSTVRPDPNDGPPQSG